MKVIEISDDDCCWLYFAVGYATGAAKRENENFVERLIELMNTVKQNTKDTNATDKDSK